MYSDTVFPVQTYLVYEGIGIYGVHTNLSWGKYRRIMEIAGLSYSGISIPYRYSADTFQGYFTPL